MPHQRKIRGVASDLEGTAIVLEELHFSAFIKAAAELGLEITFNIIREQIPHAIGGGDQLIAEGISRLNGDGLPINHLLQLKRRFYSEMLDQTSLEIRPGWLNCLTVARKRNLAFAIGSNTPIAQAEPLLEQSGLNQLVKRDQCVLLEDVVNKKPAPDIYLKTAELMGIDPREQLVFEDSVPGVEAARSAGSIVVAVPFFRMRELRHQLEAAGAHRIFLDWTEINLNALVSNLEHELNSPPGIQFGFLEPDRQ